MLNLNRATIEAANNVSFSEKSAAVALNFEVRRNRASVTQGTATVLLNGQEMITFGDEIEIVHPGEKYYGPMIGGWASKTPDYNFIRGLLWHNLDEIYHYSDKPKAVIQKLFEEV
jgi:hypothetical protein